MRLLGHGKPSRQCSVIIVALLPGFGLTAVIAGKVLPPRSCKCSSLQCRASTSTCRVTRQWASTTSLVFGNNPRVWQLFRASILRTPRENFRRAPLRVASPVAPGQPQWQAAGLDPGASQQLRRPPLQFREITEADIPPLPGRAMAAEIGLQQGLAHHGRGQDSACLRLLSPSWLDRVESRRWPAVDGACSAIQVKMGFSNAG